jgi:hypothetical protein
VDDSNCDTSTWLQLLDEQMAKTLHVTRLQSDAWAEYSDLDEEGEKGTMRLLDCDEMMAAAMHLKRLDCTRGCSESLRLRLLAQ